jgi:hypothetical protein
LGLSAQSRKISGQGLRANGPRAREGAAEEPVRELVVAGIKTLLLSYGAAALDVGAEDK